MYMYFFNFLYVMYDLTEELKATLMHYIHSDLYKSSLIGNS